HHGEWARLKVLPGTALVAVACVGLSRLLAFQPGYLYGLIAGLEFRREPEDTTGRLTSLAALTILIIGLVTWAARAPVAAASARAATSATPRRRSSGWSSPCSSGSASSRSRSGPTSASAPPGPISSGPLWGQARVARGVPRCGLPCARRRPACRAVPAWPGS